GRYRLLVEAAGRPAHRESVEVSAGRTTDVVVHLPEPPRSGRWELVIASGLVLGSASGTMADTLFDRGSVATSLIGLGGLGVGSGAPSLGVPADIPVGHSSYIIGSTLIGALEGAMVASIFSGRDCFVGAPGEDTDGDGVPDPYDCKTAAVG